MTDLSTSIINHLTRLVAFDTRNGPGREFECAQYLHGVLAAYSPDHIQLETVKRTRGRPDGAYVLAVWGQPNVLLNVHLDTVPSGEGWTGDPHVLRREGDRLIGLGASDIKGAMACILAKLETVAPQNVAVLFSGDEEQGSEVMAQIIAKAHTGGAPRAIVCEPTGCEVGRRHRGFLAYAADFTGPGGHSSLSDFTAAPVLDAARLATDLGQYGERNLTVGPDGYKGLCVNIGMIDSDGAHNVIPTRAHMRLSLRPPPGDDVSQRQKDVEAIFAGYSGAKIQTLSVHPSFATRDLGGFAPYFMGQETRPVDLPYWTEAAMLSDAGIDCVVYGPGDVDQAHKPNEFVTIDHLLTASDIYGRALSGA